ncbi:uncharacterized protein LOC133520851 [Cydia pomonella]|uniref:uncharacterized protein LOC133520851 n=1 Tax=Cydia pomonella TaxID=82600 RepID=UPI002ADD604C|nr:uncharacterized protein LOC133520851 [Cydia pomonella]
MEPQLFVEETYCGYNNMTSLTMYTINNKSLATSLHDGCAVDFDEPLNLNNTFYIECDTETSCFDESKEISRETYYLECEEVDIFSKEIMISKEHNESTTESFLLTNETTTEFYDKTTAAHGSSSEVYIFTNETITDPDGLLRNGLVNSTKVDVDTESSTAVESISKNDIAISSGAGFTAESTTSVDDILNHDVANSAKVNLFTTTTSITTTELNNELKDNHNSSKGDNMFDNETSIEHYDVLKDINANSTIINALSNNTDARILTAATENSSDSNNILAILGYSLAGIGATLALAFGAYRFKNAVQSGSYLIPETSSPPGFIELA